MSCPSRAAFVAQVQARTRLAALAEEGVARWRFELRIVRSRSRFVGRLQMVERGGGPTERTVSGDDCQEVAEALALVTALAIDPEASTVPATELLTASQPAAPAAQPMAPAPSVAAGPPAARWTASAGVAFGAELGPAPEPLLYVGPSILVEQDSTAVWSPALGLDAVIAQSGVVGPEVADARFRWLAIRAAICPVRWGQSSVSFRPCLVTDNGFVQAAGRGIELRYTSNRFWSALGGLAALRFELSESWYVDARIAAMLAITQDHYIFRNPSTDIHDTSAFAAAGGLGTGLLF